MRYSWPGNVRELQNLVEKAISFSDHNVLSLPSMPLPASPHEFSFMSNDSQHPKPLKEANLAVEREMILSALSKNRGNKSITAKRLGIARSSLYRKIGAN